MSGQKDTKDPKDKKDIKDSKDKGSTSDSVSLESFESFLSFVSFKSLSCPTALSSESALRSGDECSLIAAWFPAQHALRRRDKGHRL